MLTRLRARQPLQARILRAIGCNSLLSCIAFSIDGNVSGCGCGSGSGKSKWDGAGNEERTFKLRGARKIRQNGRNEKRYEHETDDSAIKECIL
jgi:hypothetical protein